MWLLILMCSVSVNAGIINKEEKLVNTKQGIVRGFKEQNENHFAFYGIPYATTPMGINRFKAPLPPRSWSNIFNATTKNIVCPQKPRKNEQLIYKEDCLNLNVFVPYSGRSNKTFLPVLVYIHGGAFIHSGDRGGPENILRHNVIVVTFEYRLGILGFLCLGIEGAPGNAGIKDQIAALKWVKDNIMNFGGNPENVTVYGSSAGAIAIDMIVLSNKANGLFKRAIYESASIFNGALDYNGFKHAKDLAKKLGFKKSNYRNELLKLFQTLPADVLGTAPMEDYDQTSKVGPCIETIRSNTSILNRNPSIVINERKYKRVPYMMVYGNMEGFINSFNFNNFKREMRHNVSHCLPSDVHITTERERKRLGEKIKKTYFGYKDISDNMTGFVKYWTDLLTIYPALRKAVTDVKHSNESVYLLEFSYDGGLGLPRPQYSHIEGARHSDFWAYIFKHGESAKSMDDVLTVNRLTTAVTNFVKFGDPTPKLSDILPVKWHPVTKEHLNVMSIGTSMEMRPAINDRMKLLDQIYGFNLNSAILNKPSLMLICLVLTLIKCNTI